LNHCDKGLIMKKYLLLSVLTLLIFSTVRGQHSLISTLTKNGSSANTQVSAGVSKMFEGTISNDYMRFRKLAALIDGEIKYVVTQKISGENILVKLKADTATVQVFQFRLDNGNLIMEYPGKLQTVGTYQNGDFVKIVRCKTGILFFKNNNLIDGYPLPNNNFVMYGECSLVNTQSSKAIISFTPYN
jgi:hypothetical protein